MIRSFRNRETQTIAARRYVRHIPQEIQRTAFRKLEQLNMAESLNDLRVPPGNRLERLRGDRDGQWSIRVNDQWRICFQWFDGDVDTEEPAAPYDVELVDYH